MSTNAGAQSHRHRRQCYMRAIPTRVLKFCGLCYCIEGICQYLTVMIIVISALLLTVLCSLLNCEFLNK